jgi:hypothetical protein
MDAPAEEIFQDKLLPGEHILWAGKPERRIVFSKADFYIVPSSLVGAGLVFYVAKLILTSPHRDWFATGIIGITIRGEIQMLVGRFATKAWWKGRTYYAVTDRHVLIKSPSLHRRLRFTALPIGSIKAIRASIRSDGVGTVRFGPRPAFSSLMFDRSRSSNARLEEWYGIGASTIPAFWDIEDAEYVHQLVEGLRARASIPAEPGQFVATQPPQPLP